VSLLVIIILISGFVVAAGIGGGNSGRGNDFTESRPGENVQSSVSI
tara:strand:- start:38 stop:175 length:138 start_codon:yes stop_codon:yes gene_type:complete